MRDQEMVDLMEAYASIYAPQEEVEVLDEGVPEAVVKAADWVRKGPRRHADAVATRQEKQRQKKIRYVALHAEEVEIASEYFYNLGLNEEGVNIFIEELGVEDFGNFVYQLAEEYFLDEATKTRLQSGGALKGPKGSKPQSTTNKRIRKQGGTTMSSSASPSSTVSPNKVAAAAKTAKENQPAEKGQLGAIVDRVRQGMKDHNDAVAKTKETIGKAAKGVGHVVRQFGRGLSGTAKIAGHIASKGLGEEVEAWVNALVEEGYDLSGYTWDNMVEIYLEELENLDEGRTTSLSALSRESERRRRDKERGRPETEAEIHGRLMMGNFRPGASQAERAAGGRQRLRDRGKVPKKGGEDMFEHILEHLVAEGYADTNKAALAIMANMSEEWKQSIVEAAADQSDNQIERGVKTTHKAGNVIDNQHQGRSRGLSRLPAGERKEKTDRMRRRLKARRDDLFGERRNREDAAREEMKKKYGL